MIQAPAPVRDTDVIIAIYKQNGERVTIAHGEEKRLRLWRGRWVRGGYIARQIDGKGNVREYGVEG